VKCASIAGEWKKLQPSTADSVRKVGVGGDPNLVTGSE
jgi:hypothetical protein